jgi:sugar O-acyltransferase (sialic acid O-acetyltransferase NeuD family)
MTNKVVIFGIGDFGRVAEVYLTRDSAYEVAAFTVHAEHLTTRELRGHPVVPFEQLAEEYPPEAYALLVAVGYRRVNKARAEVYAECKRRGYQLIRYASSRAMVWDEAEIGDNCFIFENNVIQPFVRIGNDVILWSGNHVGHDAVIGDHCFIASHAVIAGHVEIGPYSFIGVNATIRDGVKIGAECVIGAGALIVKDTEPGSVHVGPAAEVSRVPSNRIRL